LQDLWDALEALNEHNNIKPENPFWGRGRKLFCNKPSNLISKRHYDPNQKIPKPGHYEP
jgi:hypothetical protein